MLLKSGRLDCGLPGCVAFNACQLMFSRTNDLQSFHKVLSSALFCLIPGMVSLWSLAVVAFERWLVVCKPLGNFIFKPHHAIACCALTWVFALIAAVPPLVGWSRSAQTTNT